MQNAPPPVGFGVGDPTRRRDLSRTLRHSFPGPMDTGEKKQPAPVRMGILRSKVSASRRARFPDQLKKTVARFAWFRGLAFDCADGFDTLFLQIPAVAA
jgi:hypothetical protein